MKNLSHAVLGLFDKYKLEYALGIMLSFCTFSNNQTHAQTTVDIKRNSMRIGDVVKKYQITTDDIWNLSNFEKNSDAVSESFENFKTDTITSLFNGTRKYYQYHSDSLLYVGSENPTNKETFYIQETSYILPMFLGKKHSGVFAGYLNYCDKMLFHKYGTYTVYADSIGTLSLPNENTIDDVLQICHKRQYVYDQLDSCSSKNLPIFNEAEILQKQAENADVYTEIEKALYVRGYRYPVVTDYTLYNSKNEVCSKETYLFSPEDQEDLPLDEANMLVRNVQEGTDNKAQDNKDDISSYITKNINTKEVLFNCGKYIDSNRLSGTIQCKLQISDNQGIVYQSKDFSMNSSNKTQISLPYSGLKAGQYLLSLIINNHFFTHNIIFE